MPQDSNQNIPQLKQPEPVFQWTLEQLKGIFFPLKIILFPLVFALSLCGWIYRWLCIHPWLKLAAFPALLVIPAAVFWFLFVGPGNLITYVDWSRSVLPEEAAPFESPLRELVCPVLKDKYALEECDVQYTRPARCGQKDHRVVGMLDDAGGAVHFKIVSADHKRRIEIAQDIIRMKRELPGLPKCPYVLEFDLPRSWIDDFTPDGAKDFSETAARAVIGVIVIPDEERGYDGRGDWHFDDFTSTPGEDEEARK